MGHPRRIILGNSGTFAIVDQVDYERISKFRWHLKQSHTNVYARKCDGLSSTGKRLYTLMHRFIMGYIAECIDHKNGNGLDNRRENLRYATHAENHRNMRPRTTKKDSRFKGVFLASDGKHWRAAIRVASKRMYLGIFQTEVQAAKAYNDAATKYFGEFARLNEF